MTDKTPTRLLALGLAAIAASLCLATQAAHAQRYRGDGDGYRGGEEHEHAWEHEGHRGYGEGWGEGRGEGWGEGRGEGRREDRGGGWGYHRFYGRFGYGGRPLSYGYAYPPPVYYAPPRIYTPLPYAYAPAY